MNIFSFWEPRNKIPYYLQLCMETWKKFLPDSSVTILDMKNVENYVDFSTLGKGGIDKLFSGRFSYMLMADVIRVMLLKQHGGIWLDLDTIILSSRAEKMFARNKNFLLSFFGDPVKRSVHLASINSIPNAEVMNLWFEFIKGKLENLNADTVVAWDFFGNSFINDYAKNHTEEIEIIDRRLVMPEIPLISDSVSAEKAYHEYYFFQSRHIEDVPADMLFLHNSWTPQIFKTIGRNEFIRCNFTMANVLMAALEMKRDLKSPPIRFVR